MKDKPMKHKKIINGIDHFNSYLIVATVFLLPLFFTPFTANLFDLNKQVLIVISTGLLLISWMIRNILSKSFRLTVSPITGALFLMTLVMIIGSISGSLPRTLETFISVTTGPFFLAFFFLAATTLPSVSNLSTKIMYALVGSAAILGLLAVLETVNIGPGRLVAQANGATNTGQAFISPAGSAVILISFLIPMLILSLVYAISETKVVAKSFLFVASAIITAALVISAFTILPGKPNTPVFLPYSTSWTIAVENIKSPKKFLLGVGVNNYVQAFSTNRGIAFNQYDFWNTRFNVARNYPLHVFTTLGLLGLVSWFILLFAVFRSVRQVKKLTWVGKGSLLALAVIVITIFVIPNNLVLQGTFIFLLIALVLDLKETKSSSVSELILRLFAAKLVETDKANEAQKKLKTEVLPLIIGIPIILFCLATYYGVFRVYAADMAFRNSLIAASKNDGTGTYENQRRAIELNPYLSSYHRAYASTNLALANSIGSQENLSDENKQNVSVLIRQAIREGQNAVRINPQNPANWETMATIYRNLINAAEGATEWAVSSYSQAINLDPTNPRLWLDAGGIFYQLQNYPQAIEIFSRATALKPNWANAHYNLANAYKQNQELQRAIAQYEQVLQLVDKSSADYSRALGELNTLKDQLGQEQTPEESTTAELSEPEPIPTPVPGSENLELTEEDAPPAVEDGEQKSGFGNVVGDEASQSASPAPSPETTVEP